jgi:hypothetical protein
VRAQWEFVASDFPAPIERNGTYRDGGAGDVDGTKGTYGAVANSE